MADLIIKPATGTGNKLIVKDMAGGAVLTTADSGATISGATIINTTGAITTNSVGIRVNQTADNNGIKLYGFDDMSAHYGELYLDSIGYTNLVSEGDRSLNLRSGSSINLKVNEAASTITAINIADTGNCTFSGDITCENLSTADLIMSNQNPHRDGNEIDGTKGSWVMQEGEENMYLINRKNGKRFKIMLEEV
jgi:hypothetical protein